MSVILVHHKYTEPINWPEVTAHLKEKLRHRLLQPTPDRVAVLVLNCLHFRNVKVCKHDHVHSHPGVAHIFSCKLPTRQMVIAAPPRRAGATLLTPPRGRHDFEPQLVIHRATSK
jgi:hypothetical protein